MQNFKIGKKNIGKNYPTYFIADIGAYHDGRLSRAKKLIKLAKKAGADAVKFQHFKAETIVSDYGFKSLKSKLSHQNTWKKSVFQVYKEASLPKSWTKKLKRYSDKCEIEFMTSPYDIKIVDEINPDVIAIKIGSGDITWIDIIEKISKKKKPVILATGASSLKDVKRAIKKISRFTKKIVLMQCNTNYTGKVENLKYLNLNVLKLFKKNFKKVILGLSDHTPGHISVLASISLGARVIEKHFTDDNKRKGPDHPFAMNPKTWSEMVKNARLLEESLGDGTKKIEKNETQTKIIQRRCIRLKKEIKKGERIRKKNLIYLRPAPINSLAPFEKNKIINKIAIKNLKRCSHLKISDVKK